MAARVETCASNRLDELLSQKDLLVNAGDFEATSKLLTPPKDPEEWLLPGLVRKYDPAALESEKNQVLEYYIVKALELFNSLTKPRKKKHTAVTAAVVDDNDKSQQSLPQSAPRKATAPVCKGSAITLVSDHFFDHSLSQSQKAYYHFIRGQFYNFLPNYCPIAESNLTQAVKWDPKLVKAWNRLGECVWKRDDLNTARFCFETALNFKRDRETLCMLAMVYRLLGNTDTEKVRFLQQSIALCKEAVQSEIKNGNSWLVLGNGYLKTFFNVTHDQSALKKALNAYAKAKIDPCISYLPDVFHNESIIYEYLDDYQSAFEGYLKVQQLDPAQFGVQDRISEIFNFLSFSSKSVATKCGLDAEQLAELLGSFSGKLHYSAQHNYNQAVFSEIPVNSFLPDRVLFCKIIRESACCSIKRSFIVTDPKGDFFVVNIFHLSDKKFIHSGDELAIFDPKRIIVNFSFNEEKFGIPVIRVEDPLKIHLNGSPLPKSTFTAIWMSTRCSTD